MSIRVLVLCVAALAIAGEAPGGLRCAPGSFVVRPGTRIMPGTAGSYDVVRIAAEGARSTAALDAVCPPIRAHTRGRRITARWPRGRCGVAARVTLKLVLDAGCEIARGRVRQGRSRAIPLLAARCADDGVVSSEAGEECAAGDACGPDRRCNDCRCGPAVRFARDVQPIFQNCLTSACHEGADAAGSFELTPGRASEELLTRRSRAGACAGQPLVVAGDPDDSVLWKRIGGTACGASMPLGATLLAPAEVDVIRAWIAQGAAAD